MLGLPHYKIHPSIEQGIATNELVASYSGDAILNRGITCGHLCVLQYVKANNKYNTESVRSNAKGIN